MTALRLWAARRWRHRIALRIDTLDVPDWYRARRIRMRSGRRARRDADTYALMIGADDLLSKRAARRRKPSWADEP